MPEAQPTTPEAQSIRPQTQTARPMALPAGLEAQTGLRLQALLAGLQAWLAWPQAWLNGPEGERIDGQMKEQTENLPIP